MPSVQDTAYPSLKNNPTEKDLLTLYTPTTEELELAKRVTMKPVRAQGHCHLTTVPSALVRQPWASMIWGVGVVTVGLGTVAWVLGQGDRPLITSDNTHSINAISLI